MDTITIDSRAAAAAAGQLPSYRGDERRQEFGAKLRASETTIGDKTFVVLDGFASVTEVAYTMYDMFGEYREVIDARAFDETLNAEPDVNFLVNHAGLAMARTTAGTLDLSVEQTEHGTPGLRSVARLNPQRSDVQDLRHGVNDGAIDQMSFAFRITDGLWSPDFMEFRILKVDLNRGDVSAVNYGANPYTSISARAKQALTAIDHLEGEPLRIAAERAQARLAERGLEPRQEAEPPAKRGPNVRMLRARIEAGLA